MASSIKLTKSLRDEYSRLFSTCVIPANKQAKVEALTSSLLANKSRYEAVGGALKIPWYVVAVIHNMESSQNFKKHLHNGDPLTARTVHVPKNRPESDPPFTWEQSAEDALTLEDLQNLDDWSLPATLFRLEKYNGLGYRSGHPEVLSPYLWSFSNHYTKGKFVEDGKFDPDASSAQCGAAVLLRRMAETGAIQFSPDLDPAEDEDISALGPMVTFNPNEATDAAKKLQHLLNQFPGIFLREDGKAGQRTSDAFRKVTGHFLKGDPREAARAANA
mgnify:CR=1 FL=1